MHSGLPPSCTSKHPKCYRCGSASIHTRPLAVQDLYKLVTFQIYDRSPLFVTFKTLLCGIKERWFIIYIAQRFCNTSSYYINHSQNWITEQINLDPQSVIVTVECCIMYLLQGTVNLTQRFSHFCGRDKKSCRKTYLASGDPCFQKVLQMTTQHRQVSAAQ